MNTGYASLRIGHEFGLARLVAIGFSLCVSASAADWRIKAGDAPYHRRTIALPPLVHPRILR